MSSERELPGLSLMALTSFIDREKKVGETSITPMDDFWEIDEELVLDPPGDSNYELTIDEFFNATHCVTFNGHTGPVHAHSYRLRVRCFSRMLSAENQVVVGYHVLIERIVSLVGAYNGNLLNDLPPFRKLQPTTENLVGVIFLQLERMLKDLPIVLESITLWEAPTKAITYHRKGPASAEDTPPAW